MPPQEVLYAENLALKGEVVQLKALVGYLQNQLYGPGKSETYERSQILMKLEGLDVVAQAEPVVTKIEYERIKSTKEKRPLPAETFAKLPVNETVVIEPEEVKLEPEAFEKIGEEKTFEVDITPPKLFKREIIRPKYQRIADKAAAPVVAAAPERVVSGGYASAGLLAWVLLSKFMHHLPLFRLEQMSERWGARIARQSMSDWVRIAADCLEPIYKLMLAELLSGRYLQADETPIKFIDPDEKRGSTVQGYLWVVSRPGGDVVFDWKLSRRHGELTSLLGENYKGLLQSDGYEAYASYVRSHPGVEWLMCWAHARRKFFEAQQESPRAVRVMLKLIGRLYRLERAWDEEKIGDQERAQRRHHGFARTLKWIKALAVSQRERVLPKSGLGKACDYLLGHWEPLIAHVKYGHTKLDTNLVENAIRPSCVGKKNWLFIGHPDAGQRSAIIYSIIVSCERYGKDPYAYMRDVLTRLPAMTTKDDLTALLPSKWQPSSL
jgi:transposase